MLVSYIDYYYYYLFVFSFDFFAFSLFIVYIASAAVFSLPGLYLIMK